MNHKKLRDEMNCLNCGQMVEARFSTYCGQENLELQDSVWKLVGNYIQDLFNYDNRLWHTLKYLLLKPGQVAREYMDGKRKRNLEPIRFYVFASSIFFLLLYFSVGPVAFGPENPLEANYSKRQYHLKQEKEYRKGTSDTTLLNQLTQSLYEQEHKLDTAVVDSTNGNLEINLFDSNLTSDDSAGWLSKVLMKRLESKQAELNSKHEGDEEEAAAALIDEIFHSLPQLFFLSLPFFAFFLKMLYFRKPKNSYVEHFIFSIYFYAYLFVIMILFILIDWMTDKSGGTFVESGMSYAVGGLALYPFYYLLVSMKRFYNDRWGRLIFRFFTLLFLLLFTFLILFVGIAMFTFLW